MAYQALYRVWRSNGSRMSLDKKSNYANLEKCDRANQISHALFIYRSSGNRKNECCQNLCKSKSIVQTKSMESPAMNARCAVRSQLVRKKTLSKSTQPATMGSKRSALSETVQIMHQHKLNIKYISWMKFICCRPAPSTRY